MTGEQLFILAREFCAHHGLSVTDYAALVAAASASTAKIDGIPVHETRQQAATALYRVLSSVPALSGRNTEFARFCALVFLRTYLNR